MKKIFLLFVIFSLLNLSYQFFRNGADLPSQEQEKEMTKYELEDTEFVLSTANSFSVVNFFIEKADLKRYGIIFNLALISTPPPNYLVKNYINS